jgi:glycosyltransferase involved in cell wall biosynthesis
MHTSSSDPLANLLPSTNGTAARTPLIVFSHLRWGFVFQRPQHLLTRLAQRFDVFFVEEPVLREGGHSLQCVQQAPGVEVLTPFTDIPAGGFHDDQVPALKSLVADFMAERGFAEPLVWLYTPMALPLVADLEPRAVVYDCMDDLASFRFAPPQLLERERALMELADVVLTGGPSLYEARKQRHPNIHCLPSAVDAAHFAPCNLDGDDLESTLAAELHRTLPHPRLGFFGVIDERLDLGLVERLADLRPDWHVVMAGPVVKIDPAALPRRPNLHWIGMQRYEALPHLMSHWDVCLLPFALNEHTRFISPTKTLEYLAGGKPAVSTPIHDVVSLYGSVVRIGATAEEFVAAVESTLAESAAERAAWRAAARATVDGCTWDGTADRIAALLQPYVDARPAQAIVLDAPLRDPAPRIATKETATPPIARPAIADLSVQPLSL